MASSPTMASTPGPASTSPASSPGLDTLVDQDPELQHGNPLSEENSPSSPLPLHPSSTAWDPSGTSEWDMAPPSSNTLNRIKRDLATIYREPPPGMFVVPDKDDMTKIHALIIGPFDTPYEGGFFHFLLRCPPNYPINPPRVKLLTTGNATVRFNPNFYKSGKVCLSILGTWSGPAWSPALSLSSLLISIQSLMTDKPYHNEPGYERERLSGDVRRYNLIIQHETIRVAVLGNLENWSTNCGCGPAFPLFKAAKASLPDFMEHFEGVCKENLHRSGEEMTDPFGEKRGKFQWENLLQRLAELRESNPQWFLQVEPEEAALSDVSELSDS